MSEHPFTFTDEQLDEMFDRADAADAELNAALAGDLAARRAIEAGILDLDVLFRKVLPGRRPSRYLDWPVVL